MHFNDNYKSSDIFISAFIPSPGWVVNFMLTNGWPKPPSTISIFRVGAPGTLS